LIDACHFLSADVVSFARGLNDTPKIVSLILIIQAFSIQGGAIAVTVAMAIGEVLYCWNTSATSEKG
jgi:PiT family inorganic phosphate transporter